jgi:catechol 2,3-dioxygenase-like lactoylglutathione lyase family enzyme
MDNNLDHALSQPWAPQFTRVLRGVHHLVLNTEDMKATMDFYCGVLGMPLVGAIKVEDGLASGEGNRGNPPFENLRHYFFDMGNDSMLAFFEMPKGAKKAGDRDDIGNMQHVSFVTSPDVQLAMKARLEAFGQECIGPVEVSPGGYSVYFRDPVNNIRLEFSSHPKQGANQAVIAHRGQTKASARKELATLTDDKEWIERAVQAFKD